MLADIWFFLNKGEVELRATLFLKVSGLRL